MKNVSLSNGMTLKSFLKSCLLRFWKEGECFSGKRPLGDSGYDYEIYEALAKDGLIEADYDKDGDLVDLDEQAGYEYVKKFIQENF